MSRWLRASLVFLVVNGAYLYSFDSPTLFYVANLLFHLGVGIFALVTLLIFLRRAIRSESRLTVLAAALLLPGALSGGALVVTGTSRPYYWLLVAHIASMSAGLLFGLLAAILARQNWRLLAAALAVGVLLPSGVWLWYRSYPNAKWEITNPVVVPATMEQEGAGPKSAFFPSSANTNVNRTIPSTFFMKPESCGATGCHPDIYKQWSSSAHHFSSFNNQWYRKSIEYMQDVVGTRPSKWCAGCHDHAAFFNGMMDEPIKDQISKPEAQAGLTCTSCHSIVSVGSTMGNGHFVIEYPPLHDLATSDNHILKATHDFIVHLDPGPHRSTFIKPFMRNQTPEFCSSCHKVHLDVPVNHYRWTRGFNDYDGWQNSGISGNSARSFYYPKESKKCADCHMPMVRSNDAGNVNGLVHSHRFPGANTALPFVNGDHEQFQAVTNFLQNRQVSVDIFALSEAPEPPKGPERSLPGNEEPQLSSTFAEGDQMGFAVGGGTGYTEAASLIAPLDRARPAVRRGDSIRLDAVVRTRNVGHFFPGGTVDAFDVWVELKAVDNLGKTIFWSGYVPEDSSGRKGPVEPGAHFYRSFMLDERGNPINKRNAWMARAVLYVRLIPPGAADTVHYRLRIPEDAGDRITVTAKVNYRKFAWWNTQWAYAGVRNPDDANPPLAPGYDGGKWVFLGDVSKASGKLKQIPDLPITTMAENSVDLRVVASGTDLKGQRSVLDQKDLTRWNDYGIGLLLQGDLKAAEEIFRQVTKIDPKYADGWVNIGRVYVQEGRTEEAQSVLGQALKLNPELAKAHFFMGMTYKTEGNYDTALAHLKKAEAQYPRDRLVLDQIGRILFLKRRFAEAVETLNRVLLIDPEDLQAHYNLMLAFRGLGNQDRARHEQQLYLRFKADESSQSITGPYRLAHAEDNNERQAIHEHRTVPLDQIRAVLPAGAVTDANTKHPTSRRRERSSERAAVEAGPDREAKHAW